MLIEFIIFGELSTIYKCNYFIIKLTLIFVLNLLIFCKILLKMQMTKIQVCILLTVFFVMIDGAIIDKTTTTNTARSTARSNYK